MVFIPSACPSYEGRTHSWDRSDGSLISLNHIPPALYHGATNRAQRVDDLPHWSSHLHLWFEFSPHYFTEKSHQKVLVLTHPMASAELKFRSWVSTSPFKTFCATSHHLHFLDFLLSLMELCVFALLVSQGRQELTQILSLVVFGHTGQVCLDWMGRNKVFR